VHPDRRTPIPEIDAIRHESAEVLDLPVVPNVFIQRDPRAWVPAGALGIRAVIAALREWFRTAELTADRAGLLCGQDPTAALRTHVHLAGGNSVDEIDIASFLQQAEEYAGVDDIRDSIHKLRAVEGMSHPMAVVRAAQLQSWAASGDYREILSGTYPRREEDNPAQSFGDDLGNAAKSYKDSASESTDPLMTMLGNLGEQMAKAGSKVGEAASKLFGTTDNSKDADGKDSS